jgi:hypothetical protein
MHKSPVGSKHKRAYHLHKCYYVVIEDRVKVWNEHAFYFNDC